MTNAEMHSIQVQDAPVLLKRALSPRFELLGQRLVQTTDRAGTGSDSQQRLGHFPNFLRARSSHEHLREPFGDVGLIATVAVKDLGVELTFPISWHVEILDPTGRGDQITGVGAVAVPFALGAAFSPSHADERVELLAHHSLQHDTNATAGEFAQILLEGLLLRQWGDCLLLR